jgi:hypothetical protein
MGMTFHFIFFIFSHYWCENNISFYIFVTISYVYGFLCVFRNPLPRPWLIVGPSVEGRFSSGCQILKVESWEPRSTLILHKMSMSMIRSLSVIFPWALFILTACVACKLIKSTCRIIILIFDVHFHFSSQHFNLIQMLVKIDKLVKLFVKKKDI